MKFSLKNLTLKQIDEASFKAMIGFFILLLVFSVLTIFISFFSYVIVIIALLLMVSTAITFVTCSILLVKHLEQLIKQFMETHGKK